MVAGALAGYLVMVRDKSEPKIKKQINMVMFSSVTCSIVTRGRPVAWNVVAGLEWLIMAYAGRDIYVLITIISISIEIFHMIICMQPWSLNIPMHYVLPQAIGIRTMFALAGYCVRQGWLPGLADNKVIQAICNASS